MWLGGTDGLVPAEASPWLLGTCAMASMTPRLFIFLALILLVAPSIGPVLAQQSDARVALIIGNAAYPDAEAPLRDPANNVRSLADELRRHGFDVDVRENLTKEAMRGAIDRFYEKIQSGTTALFFFSGYGIQSDRQTYMIPVNAQIWTEPDVRRDGYSLDLLLTTMGSRGARVKIAILDASRRNPFERRFRAVAAGLAPVVAPGGTAVMFGAAPGTVVRDGERELFVNELLKEIRVPGKVEEVFNRTLIGVSRASQNEQVPWFSSSLVEEFSFVPSGRTPADPDMAARSEYQSAERIGTKKAWDDFLVKYPRGRYADQARDQLAKLTPSSDPDAAMRSEYQSAERIGTKKAWDDFLVKYPRGRYADQARDQLAKLTSSDPDAAVRSEYQSAERIGTKKAWDDFLVKYPRGRYADQARDQLAKLTPSDPDATVRSEYQSAERVGTKKAWDDFLAKYPRGRYADQARDQLAKLTPSDSRIDDPAIKELDKTLQLNPNDTAAYYKRGQLYAQHGDFVSAIKNFDEVIRLAPKDAEAFNNRCWARAVVGELQPALGDCDQALQIRPRYVDAFDSRGFVNLKMGQMKNAISDYDAALRINPKHASSLYGRGIAKLRSGNTAGGNGDIAAAKQIQPDIVDEFASYGIR
jgi:tetratricopeptide (TPR) repeat protein